METRHTGTPHHQTGQTPSTDSSVKTHTWLTFCYLASVFTDRCIKNSNSLNQGKKWRNFTFNITAQVQNNSLPKEGHSSNDGNCQAAFPLSRYNLDHLRVIIKQRPNKVHHCPCWFFDQQGQWCTLLGSKCKMGQRGNEANPPHSPTMCTPGVVCFRCLGLSIKV